MFWKWGGQLAALKRELAEALGRERKLASEKAALAFDLAEQQQLAAEREGECETLKAVVRNLAFFSHTLSPSSDCLSKMTTILRNGKPPTPKLVPLAAGRMVKDPVANRTIAAAGPDRRRGRFVCAGAGDRDGTRRRVG